MVTPTETFYGLAAAADHPAALAALAALKGRDHQPLPLIAASPEDVTRVGELPRELVPLVVAFWPGPLTVAVPVSRAFPGPIVSKRGSVGVRVPAHPVARAVARLAGGLATATSANLRGAEPATSVKGLPAQVAAAAALILDGGVCAGGLPSTVVEVEDGKVVVRRAGAVALAELARVLGYTPVVAP